MKPKKHSTVSVDWNVNPETGEFCSPSKDCEPNQILVFADRVKDGKISASITPIDGQFDENLRHEWRESGIVFRYNDREHFYLAGIGGFGLKFFIAKAPEWRLLDGAGKANSVRLHEPYHLRVEFTGDRIVLFHNDVPVLNAIDNAYFSGFCGLRVNRTKARFENVDIITDQPKCFVIMPFDPVFNFVYDAIEETVKQHGIDCHRADKRYISEPIIEDVKSRIAEADVVVVDFTHRNPNVYFEAGLADAWQKNGSYWRSLPTIWRSMSVMFARSFIPTRWELMPRSRRASNKP